MRAILASPDNRVQGFLGPGHVCTVMGTGDYESLARAHRVIARLRVEAETDARLAPARQVQTRGSRLIPAGRR